MHSIYNVSDIVVQGAVQHNYVGTHSSFILIACCLHTGVFGIATFLDTDLRIVIGRGSIAMRVSTREGCTYIVRPAW